MDFDYLREKLEILKRDLFRRAGVEVSYRQSLYQRFASSTGAQEARRNSVFVSFKTAASSYE